MAEALFQMIIKPQRGFQQSGNLRGLDSDEPVRLASFWA